MNKLKLLTLFFASLFMLTLTSCDKDDDESPKVSNTELLTAGKWNGNAVYYKGKPMSEEEFGSDIKTIQMRFNKDGFYNQYEGGEDTGSGTWEFSKDEKSLIWDKGSEYEYILVINKLTSSELFIETEEVLSDDLTDIVEYRFNR